MQSNPDSHNDLDAAYSACRDLVRALDFERFVATLFAPSEAQPHLFALYAFSAEIARVRDAISEPLPGEIRHQWWREVLSCGQKADRAGNPVAMAICDTMQRFRLPPEPFLALIEARSFDLYDDPMPTWCDLEGYCGETCSALFRLASLVLAKGEEPGGADICGYAGVAYALTGLLRAFPLHACRQQCYVPHEVLIACAVTMDEIFEGKDSDRLHASLAALRQRARGHLERYRAGFPQLDHRIRSAFLPMAMVEPSLRKMERADYHPFNTPITCSPLATFWHIGKARWC